MTDDKPLHAPRRLELAGPQDEEQNRTEARAQHEREQIGLLPIRLDDWGVGRLERDLIVAGVKDRQAIRAVRNFHASSKQSLVLLGAASAGKSVGAAFWLTLAGRRPIRTDLLGESWEWSTSCRFLSVFDLYRIQTSYDRADQAALDEAIRARALVIDDLGAEPRSVGGGLSHILYERHRYQRRTVITTNLAEDVFLKRYGERNASRLKQFGDFQGCAAPSVKVTL